MNTLNIKNKIQLHVVESLYFEDEPELSILNDKLEAMQKRINIEKPTLTKLEDYLRGMPSFLMTGYDYEEAKSLNLTIDQYWHDLAEAVSFLLAINSLLK